MRLCITRRTPLTSMPTSSMPSSRQSHRRVGLINEISSMAYWLIRWRMESPSRLSNPSTSLTAQLADRKPSAAPLQVSRGEIAGLLGVSSAEQKAFDEAYLEQFGVVGIEATTVVEPKKFVIETENATIQVDPSRSDLVEMKRIDGRRYILVAVEGEATVNGVEVNIP